MATIQGKITGDEIIDYQMDGKAGETLKIELKPSNHSNYFNMTAPEEDSAIFVGSLSGNIFSGALQKNGVYTIRVYLMRNAARRNESSTYTLQISKSSTTGGERKTFLTKEEDRMVDRTKTLHHYECFVFTGSQFRQCCS